MIRCLALCTAMVSFGQVVDSSKTLPLSLVGSAELRDGLLRLTPAVTQTSGAAWIGNKHHIADGFEASFEFRISEPGGLGKGADGFAFVLQNQGLNAMAGRGSAGGFALGDGHGDASKPGIAHSLAVFFDTHENGDSDDPSDNYVAICTNGSIAKMRWPPSRLGVARKLPFKLKDGRVHLARVTYKPPMMTVTLDDKPILRTPVEIRTVTDERGFAYVGFTAATGSGYENHDILRWSFTEVSSTLTSVDSEIRYTPRECMEGRNLCTPANPVVEPVGPDRYRIVVPAHLPWSAAIPNPDRKSVSFTDLGGHVCLDIDAVDRCSGPGGLEGNSLPDGARKALLQPDQRAGALLTKTAEGRTSFAVNSPQTKSRNNEGAFELEVTLK